MQRRVRGVYAVHVNDVKVHDNVIKIDWFCRMDLWRLYTEEHEHDVKCLRGLYDPAQRRSVVVFCTARDQDHCTAVDGDDPSAPYVSERAFFSCVFLLVLVCIFVLLISVPGHEYAMIVLEALQRRTVDSRDDDGSHGRDDDGSLGRDDGDDDGSHARVIFNLPHVYRGRFERRVKDIEKTILCRMVVLGTNTETGLCPVLLTGSSVHVHDAFRELKEVSAFAYVFVFVWLLKTYLKIVQILVQFMGGLEVVLPPPAPVDENVLYVFVDNSNMYVHSAFCILHSAFCILHFCILPMQTHWCSEVPHRMQWRGHGGRRAGAYRSRQVRRVGSARGKWARVPSSICWRCDARRCCTALERATV